MRARSAAHRARPGDTDLEHAPASTDFHTDDGMKRAPIIRSTGRWQGQMTASPSSSTGELIETQVSSFLVRDADGQPFAYATVQHDMRETKRLEAQLRQAQKMEAIGTLAGGIAHDFNNILGAILGNLELARMEVGPGHSAQNRFDEIASAGRRAVALVRQILTFGRQREALKRVIHLADIVNEAVALLRSTLSANIELVTSIAPDTPNVSADPTQVHQIILNLATNAWHAFDGHGGRIVISLPTELAGRTRSAPPLPSGERPYALGPAPGRRRRPTGWTCSSDARADLRSVLHDETSRRRNGARPLCRPWNRQGSRGDDPRREHAGEGDDV